MASIKNGNGQLYYKATPEVVSFYEKEFDGGHGDLVPAKKASARTVANALKKGNRVSSKTKKILSVALKEAGFKGEAFSLVSDD